MLEFPTIQQRGFRNVVEDGAIAGFQVPIRLKYYRGVWLSQIRPATVDVDGVKYSGTQIAWTIGGRTFEQDELADHGDVHWSNQDPALLVVRRAGGLEPGIHEVDVEFQTSTSYLPPRIDLQTWGREPRKIVLVR
jgi:Domain of unknown function (DUF6379)